MTLDISDLLKVMQSALPEKQCIYLSTPITGGMIRVSNPDEINSVVKYNIDRAIKVESEIVSHFDYSNLHGLETFNFPILINPARTVIPGFSQDQYLELWKSVIQKFAHQLWLLWDFNYSEGCVVEASFAVQLGLPIYLIEPMVRMNNFRSIDYYKFDKILSKKGLIHMIYDAIPAMKAAGLSTKSHEDCVRMLTDV